MLRVLVFLLVVSQGVFASEAVEALKSEFERALNDVKSLQADIRSKQAELEATIQNLNKLTDAVSVDEDGHVGIGTTSPVTSPKAKLHIHHDDSNTGLLLTRDSGGPYLRFKDGSKIAEIQFVGQGKDDKDDYFSNPLLYIQNGVGDPLGRVSIKADVGIGTTDPKAKLDIIGTTKTQKLQLGDKWLLSGVGDWHTDDNWLRLGSPNGADYYGGFAAGWLWTKKGSVQGSDANLKQKIETLENTLDKLLSLRGVSFKWKDSKQKSQQIGVIAQEIEKVFPELVETGPNNMKGVNYSGLIPILIEAIKEQQRQIDKLKK